MPTKQHRGEGYNSKPGMEETLPMLAYAHTLRLTLTPENGIYYVNGFLRMFRTRGGKSAWRIIEAEWGPLEYLDESRGLMAKRKSVMLASALIEAHKRGYDPREIRGFTSITAATTRDRAFKIYDRWLIAENKGLRVTPENGMRVAS